MSSPAEDDDLSHEGFSFTVNLDLGIVQYEHGYTAKIVLMFDEDDERTDDVEEVAAACWNLPNGGPLMCVPLSEADNDYFCDEELH